MPKKRYLLLAVLAPVVALVTWAGWPAETRATLDPAFTCSTRLMPPDGQHGDYGYIIASFSVSPGCMGGTSGIMYFCTTGATYASHCDPYYLYTEAGLVELGAMLQRSANSDQDVSAVTNSTNLSQGRYVQFRAAP